MNRPTRTATLFACALAALLAGCQSAPRPPLSVVPHVDLERFMGDWYVIANIPTLIERGAHDAVESYRLADDGTIDTTFTFREGGFDGEPKRYTPRGYVVDRGSNAVWGMQFVWPIKADYRIAYLAPDYWQTVIAREKPRISDEDYERLVRFVAAQGYDVSKIRTVPQRDRPAQSGGQS
jgi:apolipoprotein D and lipocalin family protein